ncbi:MAG: electron transfer flavoprotein subunit alpha/FixB family protein, partial [Frankiaceae bacterium]
MAEILVLVEHLDGAPKKVTNELLTLARTLGEPSAVWIGDGADTALDKLGEYGAQQVYAAADPELEQYAVAPKAEVLAQLVAERSPAAVLIASSAEGKEIAGRLAIKTNSGVITDAVGLSADLEANQSIFGGGIFVTSKVVTGTPIFTVRPNSVPPEPSAASPSVTPVTVTLPDAAKGARVLDRVVEKTGARPELAEAAIVVSGGRGVGGPEGFG